jgi:hypothetical protein
MLKSLHFALFHDSFVCNTVLLLADVYLAIRGF